MSFVDTTVYAAGKTPTPQLRVLFAQNALDPALRRAIADAGIMSQEMWAQAGDTGSLAADRIVRHAGAAMPADANDADIEKLKIAAIWATSRAMQTARAASELKYAEDPHKIPQIPDSERLQMRIAWKANHVELDLNDHNEPHARFVDRVRRDWIVHGRVVLYPLDQVRVEADKIAMKTQTVVTTDDFLKAVREELPGVAINGDEQFFDRIFALFVALEYLNILSVAQFRTTALRYFADLRKFRRLHPGLSYLVKADTLIRQAVDEKIKENPTADFGATFQLILDDKPHLWNSALAAVEWDLIAKAKRPPRRGALQRQAL